MLTIRKKNFEDQPCFCCGGIKTYKGDPKYALRFTLCHETPNANKYVPLNVMVPRCKKCANKMKPVIPMALCGGVLAFIFAFLKPTNSSVPQCLIIGVLVAVFLFFILKVAFGLVYKQRARNYELYNVLVNEYGWETSERKLGGSDPNFTQDMLALMLDDLEQNYDCEFRNV